MTGRIFRRAFAASLAACALYVWLGQLRYEKRLHIRYGPLSGQEGTR